MLKNRERITISVPKGMKAELEEVAQKEVRTLSNLVEIILTNYLKNISGR